MDDEVTVTDPPDPIVDPPADPTAAELAQLRKEKADREAADKAAADAELAELRAHKAAHPGTTPAVKAPTPKAQKATPAAAPAATPAVRVRKKGRSGASRLWFGADEDE
jgi:hypothetical protein